MLRKVRSHASTQGSRCDCLSCFSSLGVLTLVLSVAVLIIAPARSEELYESSFTALHENAALSPVAGSLSLTRAGEDGTCPALPFHLFVASAMGYASSIRALSTCAITPYSTILNDMHLARHTRESAESVTAGLWRLTHGNTEDFALYDNAAEFLSLRAEIGAWVRANRTVGMNPSAYEAAVRGAAAVLGLNGSLLDTPFVELPVALEGGVTPLNWTNRLQRCRDDVHCIRETARAAYRHHANTSLAAAPTMLVSKLDFRRAQRYYEQAVFSSSIVRAFHLHPATTTRGFSRALRNLLRAVQQTWDAVAREAAEEVGESEGRAGTVVAAPYLPVLRETDITGPRRPETRRLRHHNPAYPSPSRDAGVRLQALRRVLPTAVLYESNPDCTSCAVFDQAFDILPAVYKRMCSRDYRSIVSCSPITLFLRTTHVRPFRRLPAVELYARLAYSRAAVLRAADLSFFHWRRGGSENKEESVRYNDADADGANGGGGGGAESFMDTLQSVAEEEEEDDEVDGTRSSLFYSLQLRHGRFGDGMEDEVRPQTQFHPRRIPLRVQPSAATVEAVVVNIIADLVESGVIQFLFLDPREVHQIAWENEQVKEMLLREQQEKQASANGTAGENGTLLPSPSPSSPSSSFAGTAPQQAPSPANLEDHPRYRKVVSFHDLATKLVNVHTRAIFGDVRHVRSHPAHRFDNAKADNNAGVASPSSLLWWTSSWVLRVPRAVLGLLFSGVERPLYITVFVLLCLYQRWWNRWQQVSYW
jgi:hypothetical protein